MKKYIAAGLVATAVALTSTIVAAQTKLSRNEIINSLQGAQRKSISVPTNFRRPHWKTSRNFLERTRRKASRWRTSSLHFVSSISRLPLTLIQRVSVRSPMKPSA